MMMKITMSKAGKTRANSVKVCPAGRPVLADSLPFVRSSIRCIVGPFG
jgi:hypothetical protein